MFREIEAQGQLVMDDLAPGIAERQAEAEAAQLDLVAIDSRGKPSEPRETAKDGADEAAKDTVEERLVDPARELAEKRFVDAHKTICAPLWHAAREALLNCALVAKR